jgi:hypothetical protein
LIAVLEAENRCRSLPKSAAIHPPTPSQTTRQNRHRCISSAALVVAARRCAAVLRARDDRRPHAGACSVHRQKRAPRGKRHPQLRVVEVGFLIIVPTSFAWLIFLTITAGRERRSPAYRAGFLVHLAGTVLRSDRAPRAMSQGLAPLLPDSGAGNRISSNEPDEARLRSAAASTRPAEIRTSPPASDAPPHRVHTTRLHMPLGYEEVSRKPGELPHSVPRPAPFSD